MMVPYIDYTLLDHDVFESHNKSPKIDPRQKPPYLIYESWAILEYSCTDMSEAVDAKSDLEDMAPSAVPEQPHENEESPFAAVDDPETQFSLNNQKSSIKTEEDSEHDETHGEKVSKRTKIAATSSSGPTSAKSTSNTMVHGQPPPSSEPVDPEREARIANRRTRIEVARVARASAEHAADEGTM